jgi:hypothetical protein
MTFQKSSTIIFLFFICFGLKAKKSDTTGFYEIHREELRLCKIAPLIMTGETDEIRIKNAAYLFSGLKHLLETPNVFYFPFDSLRSKSVSILNAPDEKLRIFTYNSIQLDGTYSHYGFIFLKQSASEFVLFEMRDNSNSNTKGIEQQELDVQHWLGSLYYSITPFKLGRKKLYLLLGYDGADIHSNKKILDILSFENGWPVFGKDIFLDGDFDKEADCRVIYEFHNESRMVMRYENKQRIVVVDKLAPAFPEAVNDFYYYIPSGDYDYYALKKGYWVKDALENLNLGQGKKRKKPKLMPSPESDPQNLE